MVMLTEGVHNGSGGPVLYTDKELEKYPESWNTKPVVVYHPTSNGQGISACDSTVIASQGVGMIMNTVWDSTAKKLRAEAWIDTEKADKVDPRILSTIRENKLMEISTGLFSDEDDKTGIWMNTGEEYKSIAINHRPDHLALLPDQIGACSVADGAGLLQTNAEKTPIKTNILSHADIRQRLQAEVRKVESPYWVYVVDVFDTWFVYEKDSKMMRLTYSVANDIVSLSGTPEEVMPMVVYQMVNDGTVITNSVSTSLKPDLTRNGEKMDRKAIILKLTSTVGSIFNMGADKQATVQYLEQQSDEFLVQAEAKLETPAPAPAPVVAPATTQNAALLTNTTPKAITAAEYVQQAPPQIQYLLNNALQQQAARRASLVSVILGNARNRFTADELNAIQDDNVLERMAALAQEPEVISNEAPMANYGGLNGLSFPTVNASRMESSESPLIPYAMGWDS
jgi:hypothetical protein